MLFIEYLKIFFSFGLIFFLPGFSLLYLLFREKKQLSPLEYFLFSLGLSIAIVNLGMIAINRLGLPLNSSNILTVIIFLTALPLVMSTFPSWSFFIPKKRKEEAIERAPSLKIPSYLNIRKNILLTLLMGIFLSFFITAFFLQGDIVPNNTDLGHHMYWVKAIKESEKIIPYNTNDVVVGEHLPFVVLTKITNISILSSFPVLVLMFINAAGVLTIFALSLRIFKNQTIALLSFLLTGVLYSIAAPMGKFVSGGVVGNILGNLYIPLIILGLYLFIYKNDRVFLAISILLFTGIFYIHHLSTFLLIFIIFAVLVLYLLFYKKSIKQKAVFIVKSIFSPLPLLISGLFVFSVCVLYTPSYIESSAVQTIIQEPKKDSHQGITLDSLISSIGEWKALLGFLGLALLMGISIKKKSYKNLNFLTLTGWATILLILSFYPKILLVDLPSRRIVNYLAAPFSILAGFFLVSAFHYLRPRLEKRLFAFLVSGFILSLILNGLSDSIVYFKKENQFSQTVQLYHASSRLEKITDEGDIILKDHSSITADTWIKYFFQRGYDYVLAKTFNYKYEDPVKKREVCTRDMVLAPDSESGLECYLKTGVNYVILKKDTDNFFFDLSDNFFKIYENNEVVIYHRKAN